MWKLPLHLYWGPKNAAGMVVWADTVDLLQICGNGDLVFTVDTMRMYKAACPLLMIQTLSVVVVMTLRQYEFCMWILFFAL